MVGIWVFTLCEVPWVQTKRSVSGNVIRDTENWFITIDSDSIGLCGEKRQRHNGQRLISRCGLDPV